MCSYCEDKMDTICLEKGELICIDTNINGYHLLTFKSGAQKVSIIINNCPWCGRNLSKTYNLGEK